MAESGVQADSSAALESPLQHQLKEDEVTFQRDLSLLGKDLERLLDAVKREQEEIETKVEVDDYTAEQYQDFINRLHRSRALLYSNRTEWEKIKWRPSGG